MNEDLSVPSLVPTAKHTDLCPLAPYKRAAPDSSAVPAHHSKVLSLSTSWDILELSVTATGQPRTPGHVETPIPHWSISSSFILSPHSF